MKIAILCHSSTGGSGILATELALGLAQLGHEVHLVGDRRPHRLPDEAPLKPEEAYRDLGETPPALSLWGQLVQLVSKSFTGQFKAAPQISSGKVRFHEILSFDYPLFESSSLPTLRAANTLATLIERYQIDVINAHYVIPHATAALLARESGVNVRVVTTLHGTDVTKVGRDPAFSYTTRHAINASDAVTSVCGFLATEAAQNFGITRPIEVIPNWVDSKRFTPATSPEARARYAHPDELLFIHASNFRSVKRSPEVISIFSQVAHQRPARLLLVGDGPEKETCLQRAAELGCEGRIISLPPLVAIEDIMRLADILLLPSEIEAFPLVILEAMASGVIPIASRVGGIPELISHAETGFLAAPEETALMAKYALEVASTASLRESIKERGRRLAVERFNPEIMISRYCDIYRATLNNEQGKKQNSGNP